MLLCVVGGEEEETVVVVTDAEDGCGGLMGRIDADMTILSGSHGSKWLLNHAARDKSRRSCQGETMQYDTIQDSTDQGRHIEEE